MWLLGDRKEEFDKLVDQAKVLEATTMLLSAIGADLTDENLVDTPARVTRFWEEFIGYDCGNLDTTFESVQVDQLVVVKDIEFYSLCSHHLLPFIGTAHVGYLAGSRVIGLSKVARIVQKHAHKLQLQERMANDIANELSSLVEDSLGVAVVLEARHLCMQMRGIRSTGKMVTSVMTGDFREHATLRQEFLSLLK